MIKKSLMTHNNNHHKRCIKKRSLMTHYNIQGKPLTAPGHRSGPSHPNLSLVIIDIIPVGSITSLSRVDGELSLD